MKRRWVNVVATIEVIVELHLDDIPSRELLIEMMKRTIKADCWMNLSEPRVIHEAIE